MAASFLLANTSSAYYYYTYFNSTASPYTPIVARFDLNTLTNNTVPFFVSSTGPSKMYPGDTLAALVSQMNAAAEVWNNVGTSSIRLAYGGFYNPGTTESAPGIQIEFSDDIPPGLLALSIPTVVGGFSQWSQRHLPAHLPFTDGAAERYGRAGFDGPSYSEQFFVTLVHEFGHTMGLQHTLASSVMSTLNTSASSKANPLGADDIAGISLLYPAGKYLVDGGQHLRHGKHERDRLESGVGGGDFAQQSRRFPRSPIRTAHIRSTAFRRESITFTCIPCRRRRKAKAVRITFSCRKIPAERIYRPTPDSPRSFIPAHWSTRKPR